MPAPLGPTLLRRLLKVVRAFDQAKLPLVGIVGFDGPPVFDVSALITRTFRQTPDTLIDEGFRALRHLQHQMQVLQQSDEETRQALAAWHGLMQNWRDLQQQQQQQRQNHDQHQHQHQQAARPALAPLPLPQLCAAFEDGALLVGRLQDEVASPIALLEEQDDDDGSDDAAAAAAGGAGERSGSGSASGSAAGSAHRTSKSASSSSSTSAESFGAAISPSFSGFGAGQERQHLDALAAQVAARHSALFAASAAAAAAQRERHRGSTDGGGGDGGAALPNRTHAQLEAISEVLFRDLRYKHEPVEWVYDGCGPALLPYVLRRRRGVPYTLALLYCSVAARLGVAAMPVVATAAAWDAVAQGPVGIKDMPPEVAARQAGRTLAVAPTPDCWLVAAPAAPPSGGNGSSSGRVAYTDEVSGASASSSSSSQGAACEPSPPASWLFVDVDRRGRVLQPAEALARFPDLAPAFQGPGGAEALRLAAPSTPLELWCAMARVLVTAHTRRGESDLVAHWLVQVLALDHRAPEWRAMMAPSQRAFAAR